MNVKNNRSSIVMRRILILFGALLGVWQIFYESAGQAFAETSSMAKQILPVSEAKADSAVSLGNWDFYPGDYANKGLIGMSLPGNWRPYSDSSPWNTPISDDAIVHPDSAKIINVLEEEAKTIRFVNAYSSPIWVVNSANTSQYKVKSDKIFDFWDKDLDGWSDEPIPIDRSMWGESTPDGHIVIIDPFKMLAWEMSRFKWDNSGAIPVPTATTFNVWDLKGPGHALPLEGKRWHERGGRGSGFPVLAGLIRPEELAAGEIRHALMFNFSKNRKGKGDEEVFIAPPAVRSDGQFTGDQYPIQGMRFQLNPELTDADFNAWGLTKEAKVVARALQRYGMFLGDDGGAMSIGVQLLASDQQAHLDNWEKQFPGLYHSIKGIPTHQFRLIYTGSPVSG